MERFIKVRVKREVVSKTAMGINSEKTFRFPLDSEGHHLEMMELETDFQILSFEDDLSSAIIKTEVRVIHFEKDGCFNYCAIKKEPRFIFFIYFDLIEEEYESSSLDEYELEIKETIFRRDTYSSSEKHKEYRLPIKLNASFGLKLFSATLLIAGIDRLNKKVRINIDGAEVEVTNDKPGQYEKSGQSGYNDSFEAWGNEVVIRLSKKQIRTTNQDYLYFN